MINVPVPLGIILLHMVHEFAGGVVIGCHGTELAGGSSPPLQSQGGFFS